MIPFFVLEKHIIDIYVYACMYIHVCMYIYICISGLMLD